MSKESESVFKVPALPKTPVKQIGRRKIEWHDSDDEVEEEMDLNCSTNSSRFPGSPLKSQSMSQLSQMANNPGQVGGRFTYLSELDVSSPQFPLPHPLHRLNPSNEPIRSNDNFARSLQHLMDRKELLVPIIGENISILLPPFNANAINLLRYYLRYYPYLNRSRFKEDFMAGRAQYLNFWRQFLLESIYSHDFNRQDLNDILWDQNNKQESLPSDYLINMLKNIYFFHKKYIRNAENDKQNQQQQQAEAANDGEDVKFEDTFAFRIKFFELFVDFLTKDALHFCRHRSRELFVDLTTPEEFVVRPTLVRMFWSTKKPDYTSSIVLTYISYVAKTIHIDILVPSLIKLLSLVAEVLRLGTGNLRPYTSINSSRVLIVSHLAAELVKWNAGPPLPLYRNLFGHISTCAPWLRVQLAVELLSVHKFLNIYHYFPHALENPKYRLTLRLLVYTYLLGDVSKFKYDLGAAELRRRRRRESTEAVLARSSRRIRERREMTKKDESIVVDGVNDLKRYINTKTSYGGNALHVLCRGRGGKDMEHNRKIIAELLASVDVNQTEHRGYTPLMDAVRLGQHKLALLLIKEAERTETAIDFTVRSLDTLETALHLAIHQDDWPTIKAILEAGGKHLLTIEAIDSVTPLDLIEKNVELKAKIDKLSYQDYEQDVLPEWRVDDDEAKLYVYLVAQMLEGYLATTKIASFVITNKRGKLETDAMMHHFGQNFRKHFDRKPMELDVDNFKDDAAVFLELKAFVEQFLRRQFTVDETDAQQMKMLDKLRQEFLIICNFAEKVKRTSCQLSDDEWEVTNIESEKRAEENYAIICQFTDLL